MACSFPLRKKTCLSYLHPRDIGSGFRNISVALHNVAQKEYASSMQLVHQRNLAGVGYQLAPENKGTFGVVWHAKGPFNAPFVSHLPQIFCINPFRRHHSVAPCCLTHLRTLPSGRGEQESDCGVDDLLNRVGVGCEPLVSAT